MRFFAATTLAWTIACTPGNATPPPDDDAAAAAPVAIDNPAAPGSGEPHLFAGADGRVHLSWLEPAETGSALRVTTLSPDDTWSPPQTVVEADDLFVNWADFPSVIELEGGGLVAHWLQRLGSGTYAYGVQMSRSAEGSWSEPWAPHDDASPTEHGFVSVVPEPGGAFTTVWLDGRAHAPDVQSSAADDPAGGPAMSLRARRYGADGQPEPEMLLDARTCDCCQTGAAMIGDALVVAYRGRSMEEIRDIEIVRRVDGEWSAPMLLADDGWQIAGCPVNGPSVAATGDASGAVAWFSLVDQSPRVQVAFTADAGTTFSAPLLIEQGTAQAATLGRVGIAALDDGAVVVSWLTQVGDTAEVRYRRAAPDGHLGPVRTAATTGPSRSSGFPRLARRDDQLILAWTDTSVEPARVRTARLPLPD